MDVQYAGSRPPTLKRGDITGLLEAVRGQYPDDAPSRLYLDRCHALLAAPPGPEWDAVTVMEAK